MDRLHSYATRKNKAKFTVTFPYSKEPEKQEKDYSPNNKYSRKNSPTGTKSKTTQQPGNSQSRQPTTTSMTSKTIRLVIHKNQEKTISQIRHFSFSQIRHLKTASLTFCPPG